MGDSGNLDLLRFVGEALYGERWQSPLATDLCVSDRAVRYWLSAANRCPEDLGARILTVLARKKHQLSDLETLVLERIEKMKDLGP